jgi:hypothetical protein|tara:strand:+ start:685 stop:1203 length:519 start_codon:yes stop_codon:yes gene_type:complete
MLLLLNLSNSSTSVIEHSINNSEVFKKLALYDDHQKFINQFCIEVPDDVKVDLESRLIYNRVSFLLDQLNEILKNPDSQMIINYESVHYKYKVLLGICAMKYTVSVTHHKTRGIDYVTFNTSFEPRTKTNYVRNVHRIVGRFDSYSGRNDPKLYQDARNKYFQDLLHKYDKL